MAENPTFFVGLTLAGAISAGAYSAGVLDFLLEALNALNDVREGRDTGYLKAGLTDENPVFDPPHDVKIAAISGTSAGAMVAAITATILGTRVPPVPSSSRPTDATGNPFYDAWVREIHYDKLLNTDDLRPGEPVRSLLNSRCLQEIVGHALSYSSRSDQPRPYVTDPLPIILCVSNLRGVAYSLGLNAAEDLPDYQMSMHADWLGFSYQAFADRCPSGMHWLGPRCSRQSWDMLGNAALASGAFPFGLAAQPLSRPFQDYVERDWFDPGALLDPVAKLINGVQPDPTLPTSWKSRAGDFVKLPPSPPFPGQYDFVTCDGGLFNNEPFELCRRALKAAGSNGANSRNPRDPRVADRAVLLIEPFPPSLSDKDGYDADTSRDLLSVAKTIAKVVIQNARFKADELALANNPDVASRFAIMPSRYDEQDRRAEYAIACGSLGGFGGFLSQYFRHHDLMLGRRNCQQFLNKHFVLPFDRGADANPLFKNWTDEAMINTFLRRTGTKGQATDVPHLPIIPLLGKLASSDYTTLPPWPEAPDDVSLQDLRMRTSKRAEALKKAFMEQLRPGPAVWTGAQAVWFWKRRQWLKSYALQPLAENLRKRGITIKES